MLDLTFTKTILRCLNVISWSAFCITKNISQMSQYFDRYISVLQVLIENYWTSVKNKVKQFSDKDVRTTRLSKRVPMALQSSLEPRMLQTVPVFMVALMCIYVFFYFTDDQIESRSILLQMYYVYITWRRIP